LNESLSKNLVHSCQQGDKTAYATLVGKHYRSVFAVCLGMLGNVHDAEDMAQETMLKGFRKIRNLGGSDKFEAWILRIAKNLCIDFLRRRKRTKEIITEQIMKAKTGTNENHVLQQAVRRLPQELRLPLTMYYFEEKNAKIIAEKLDISHSGACQKIRQARKMLHEILTERLEK
jgi:RNA polymerase sigma-70 factor (ECF subfamily)